MKKILLLIFYGFNFFLSQASTCVGPKYYLTEILANEEHKHHIFTCEILSTQSGYYTTAIVKDVYRGRVLSDTVKMFTGDGSSFSGERVAAGEEWLIISEKRNDEHYSMRGCYNLSARISNNPKACVEKYTRKGLSYLEVIKKFVQLENIKFTGDIDLISDEYFFAKATFKNGKSSGTWKHYGYRYEMKLQGLVYQIDYKNGKIEGSVLKYYENTNPKLVEYESYTKDGKLQYEIYSQRNSTVYTYPDTTSKQAIYTSLNNSGDTVMSYTTKYIDFQYGRSNGISYKEGNYFNMRDSTSFSPLAEGKYVSGKKVGKWKYFNKNGQVVDSIFYEERVNDKLLTIVGEDIGFRNEGKLKKGRRVGRWKQFYDNRLENDFYYNDNHQLQLSVRYYSTGGKLSTPYRKGKKHGLQQQTDSLGVLTQLTEYKNGTKNGNSISFDAEGNITNESIYKNGRETTIYSTSTNAPRVDGFLHGYNIQLAQYKYWKMYEGEFNMGRRVGKHTSYRKDGSISSIAYYPTMKEIEDRSQLENPCEHRLFAKTEYYNKEGKLLSVE